MKQRILVEHGVCIKLEKQFHASPKTVRAALRFRTATLLAKKIRHAALILYNGVVVEINTNNCCLTENRKVDLSNSENKES